MKPKIPPGRTRLLLVEGEEDQQFFIQLGAQLTSTDEWPIHINQYKGKSKLADFLIALAGHPKFGQVETIGIVRDADYNTDALQSAQQAIINANVESSIDLPVPQRASEMARGSKNVIAFILPAAGREGMLEDLIMDVLYDDPVTACVDTYLRCLAERELSVLQHRVPKARLRTFITGKNIGSDSEGNDSDRQYLSDVFSMSWWQDDFWHHPAFDSAKAFLRQLLAV